MPTHQVNTGFLCDPDLDDWPPLSMWLYVCLWSNPQVNGLTGIYRRPSDRIMKVWTRLSDEELREHWHRVTSEITSRGEALPPKVREFNGGWLWVVGKANHAIYSNTQAIGAMVALKQVPGEVAAAFVEKYRSRLAGAGITDVEIKRSGVLLYRVSGRAASTTTAQPAARTAARDTMRSVRPGGTSDPV